MKKLTTTMMQQTLNKQDGCLTVGLNLGDRSSFYCVSNRILRRQLHPDGPDLPISSASSTGRCNTI
jgi:hypothetical protein